MRQSHAKNALKTRVSRSVGCNNVPLLRSLGSAQNNCLVAGWGHGKQYNSALMLRTDHAWHAVRPIECPEDKLRRVFIVVVNPDSLFWKVRDRVIGKKIQRF